MRPSAAPAEGSRGRVRRLLLSGMALLVFGAGASLPGCSGCRGKAPLSFAPADALMVLSVPSLAGGIREAKLLIDKFRDQLAVKMMIDQVKGQIQRELGVDPENPETWKSKGVDPNAGLVASLAGDGKSAAVVFGVSDGKAADKTLRELASKLLGGGVQYQEKAIEGVKVTTVVPPGSDGPQLAWAEVKKHLIICPTAREGKLAEHVARVANLKNGIQDNPTFARLADKLGKYQVMLYVDGPAAKKVTAAKLEEDLKSASEWSRKHIKERQEATQGFLAYLRGAALSLKLGADGIVLRGYLGVTPEKGKTVEELLRGSGEAVPFARYMGPDALAVTRFSLHVKKLMDRMVEALPPGAKRGFYARIEAMERETKINFDRDLLGLLSNRFAGALFAPGPELSKLGLPRSSMELISRLPVLLMAQVTDTGKAADLLGKLERALVMRHVEVRTRVEGDQRIYSLEQDARALISWTVTKNMLLIATSDRLAKTALLINKGGDNVLDQVDNSRAKSLLKAEDGLVFYYNISKTADLVRSLDLPTEIKAILSAPLATLSRLSDAMIDFEVENEGVLGELVLRVK